MLLQNWIPAFAGMTGVVIGLSSTLFDDDPLILIPRDGSMILVLFPNQMHPKLLIARQ